MLGALFSSRSYQKNETDLAIIVTPRLVRPARPGDSIRTPLDNTLPPNDTDFFLMGKPEVTPQMAKVAAGASDRIVNKAQAKAAGDVSPANNKDMAPLQVVAVPDLPAYQRLWDEKLSALPGVQRVESTLVMKTIVDDRPLPI